jgi:hypothetical protein
MQALDVSCAMSHIQSGLADSLFACRIGVAGDLSPPTFAAARQAD